MYGELKFVDENSVEKSPDSVQQTPDGSSGAGSKSFTTGSNSGGGGGKTGGGGGSGGSGGRKTGGSTWTIGQGSPQAPETSHPVACHHLIVKWSTQTKRFSQTDHSTGHVLFSLNRGQTWRRGI